MAKKVSKLKNAPGSKTKPDGAKAKKATGGATPESGEANDLAAMLNSYGAETRAVVEAVTHDVGAIRGVVAGVKWNSVSFRAGGESGEWFATVNVRAKEGIVLVLHAGARGKNDIKALVSGLKAAQELRWLGVDRAVVNVESAADWKRKWKVLKLVMSTWAACVR